MTISSSDELPSAVRNAIDALGIAVTGRGRRRPGTPGRRRWAVGRIRLIGGSAAELYAAVGGRPDLAVYAQPVTEAGRVELLPFLHEQAVSITAHRFGTPNHLSDDLI